MCHRINRIFVKKLHILIIKSFLGPFILTFFIVMFILLMQFVWKYIDDFMGKGLEYHVIAELLIYASANLVTLALPLAVLLSSIMTFGGLAEHYELVAMKSTGLSLFRIMMPLIFFTIGLSFGAFYFSNTISPLATLKFKSLLWDVTHKKPGLELKEGVFYNGVEGYSIRVMEKDDDANQLKDVLIYSYDRALPGNRHVIRAKEGKMLKSADGRYLVLELIDGVSYDELGKPNEKEHPQIKSTFARDFIQMDLSGFELQRTDENLWKNHMKMLSLEQLKEAIDSLKQQRIDRKGDFDNYMARSINLDQVVLADSLGTDTLMSRSGGAKPGEANFASLVPLEKRRVVNVALNMTRNAKNYMERTATEMKGRDEYINEHRIEWHRKLTLSFACLILFFIGAPLGAIIKKGGLGLPVIFSVLFFLVWHITSISGEKMVETGVLTPFWGMWLSSLILMPVAIFLTYKAAKDAALFDRDTYNRIADRILTLLGRTSDF